MSLARKGQLVDRATVNVDSNVQCAATLVTYTLMWDHESHKGKSPVENRALQIPRGEKTQVPQGLPTKLYEWLACMSTTLSVWDEVLRRRVP